MSVQLPGQTEQSQTAIQLVDPQQPKPLDNQKQQFEQAKMSDVLFLLDLMFTREETTVRLMIDCLYDVGAVNLIDQRVQRRWLNRIAKRTARLTKPVVRIVALRWFKRNCPTLITNWLYTKIKFEPQQVAEAVEAAASAPEPQEMTENAEAAEMAGAAIETAPTASNSSLNASQSKSLAELDLYRREVQQLHSQVKLLATLLIGVTVTLGGGLVWSVWHGQTQFAISQPGSSKLAEQERSHR